MTTRRPSRWAIRRQGEILGHLVRHPGSTAEDIAEHYKRHPDQVLATLHDLADAGDIAATKTTRTGLLGHTFIVVEWDLASDEPEPLGPCNDAIAIGTLPYACYLPIGHDGSHNRIMYYSPGWQSYVDHAAREAATR